MAHFTCNVSNQLMPSLNLLYPTKPEGPMVCVEIGSFEGRGSIMLNDHLLTHEYSKLYCIDPFDDEYVKNNEKMSFWDSACNGQLSRFRHNTSPYSKIIEVKGTSDDMIKTLDDNSIDFAYIDGDHSPEQVYIDAVNIFTKVKNNGIILFDDYLWNKNGIVTKYGIDKFLTEYEGKFELLLKTYQLAVRVNKE